MERHSEDIPAICAMGTSDSQTQTHYSDGSANSPTGLVLKTGD